eukprot:scaffold105327_cov69-Phaeocystis_antarctica.AAC.2
MPGLHREEVAHRHTAQVLAGVYWRAVRKEGDDLIIDPEEPFLEREPYGGDRDALRERVTHVAASGGVRPPPALRNDRATAREHESVEF